MHRQRDQQKTERETELTQPWPTPDETQVGTNDEKEPKTQRAHTAAIQPIGRLVDLRHRQHQASGQACADARERPSQTSGRLSSPSLRKKVKAENRDSPSVL